MTCQTCHNPHDDPHGRFLVNTSDDLCGTCHAAKLASLAGAHDMTHHPDAVNGKNLTAAETGKCGFCHAVHDALGPSMWAAAPNTPSRPADMCVPCHREGGVAANTPAYDLRHPVGPATSGLVKDSAQWPLFNEHYHRVPNGFITCDTCHAVHGDSAALYDLLRTTDRNDTTGACLSCHERQRTISTSLHAPSFMRPYQKQEVAGSAPYCLPCHIVHAPPASLAVGTWAGPLGPEGVSIGMRKCLGCHGSNGPAPQVRVTLHPETPIRSILPPDDESFLPLIDAHGRAGIEGGISCRTCHVPHGRTPSLGLPAVDPTHMDLREVQGLDTMLRPFLVPNLCSSCHGFEGLSNFLYYHYPEKREKISRRIPVLSPAAAAP